MKSKSYYERQKIKSLGNISEDELNEIRNKTFLEDYYKKEKRIKKQRGKSVNEISYFDLYKRF